MTPAPTTAIDIEHVGRAVTDSARVTIIDPMLGYQPGDTWPDEGDDNGTVTVETGSDGAFDVYVERDDLGRCVAVVLVVAQVPR